MKWSQTSARRAYAWGMVSMLQAVTGCAADAEDPEVGGVGQSFTVCQGQSCDGQLPIDTPCLADRLDTGLGAPILENGVVIGGIGLFRSPSCQTVWASSTFYASGPPMDYRICAVRRRASVNDPSCQDYTASLGNDSPMKYANSGKVVFGKITVNGVTTRTPDYTVP